MDRFVSALRRFFRSIKNDVNRTMHFKIIVGFLILLLIFSPVLVSLIFTTTWLSSYVFGAFLRELLISTLLVTTFFVLSKALDIAVDKFAPFMMIPSYNEMLLASEVKSITSTEMSSIQLQQALKKWMWQENSIGWFEIQEITQGNRLSDTSSVLMVKQELSRLEQNASQGISSNRNHDYSEKLKSLLPSTESRSLNQAIEDFDEGNASEEDVKNTMVINYFAKWTCKGDESGWIAIDEMREEKQPLTAELAKLELWRLKETTQRHDFVNEINRLRLKSLLLS